MLTQKQIIAARKLVTVNENKEIYNDLSVKVDDMPGCCGLSVVHDLIDLKDTAASHAAFISDHLSGLGTGAVLASTIPSQTAAIASLKKIGFKAISKAMGNHGNLITLWQLNLRPLRKTALKKVTYVGGRF